MRINPFIPIPVMAVLCVILLVFKRKGVWPYIRQIVMVLLIFAMNLRIMIPNDEVKVSTLEMNANVIFVVDDTISMAANDVEPTRLEAVYETCEYITEKLMGSKFSVISFNNLSTVLCPYSDDITFVNSIIRSIYPLSEFSAQGSDLSLSKNDMKTQLKNAKDQGGYTVLFFLSDGEDNKTESEYKFSELASLIDNGAVLGYGTSKGGEMYVRSYFDDEDEPMQPITTYVSGQGYVNAISRIDEVNLNGIASGLGVDYYHMQGDNSVLDSLLNNVISNVDGEMTERTEEGFDETYYYFAIGILVMFILEAIFTKKQLAEKTI